MLSKARGTGETQRSWQAGQKKDVPAMSMPKLVIVFTPGKTGTKSLTATLSKYFRAVRPGEDIVHQTHWLLPQQASGLADAFLWKNRGQVEQRADNVRTMIDRFAEETDSVVFTTIRNPVMRVKSDFFYRCPRLLAQCLEENGNLAFADELSALLHAAAANQVRKESEWWRNYGTLFGIRLRDMKEIAQTGFAIREWNGRRLVVLQLEALEPALLAVFERFGWPTKHLKMVRANVSPVETAARTAVNTVLRTPVNVIRAAECFPDWLVAYPQLASLSDVRQAPVDAGSGARR
jgi:hypothetical protein